MVRQRFGIVDGDDIEQGDILEGCPVSWPPDDLVIGAETTAKFVWQRQDLIVMTQSCDLSKGREKVDDVLLCAVWKRSELSGVDNHLGKAEGLEDARRGRWPGVHVLAASATSGFEREVRAVDFRQVHSLPVPFVRNTAKASKRLRLLPPYREHLSQSFARFFMRVGLPVDIPPFTGKKNA